MNLLCSILEILFWLATAFTCATYLIREYEFTNSDASRGLDRGALNTIALFAAELGSLFLILLATPLALVWPFRVMTECKRPPVLFVHGYSLTRSSLLFLAWRLRRRGYDTVVATNYRTYRGNFDRMAETLSKEIDRALEGSAFEKLDIVSHSLGGLVARAALRDPATAQKVRRLVTLGTPHQGTKLAGLTFDPFPRHLLPGSRLLEDLIRDDRVPEQVEATSIYSPFDAVVLPPGNAYYPGATNVEVDGVGHHALLFSPKICRLVAEALEA